MQVVAELPVQGPSPGARGSLKWLRSAEASDAEVLQALDLATHRCAAILWFESSLVNHDVTDSVAWRPLLPAVWLGVLSELHNTRLSEYTLRVPCG